MEKERKVISSVHLESFSKIKNGSYNYSIITFCERYDLTAILFEYADQINIDGYEVDEEQNILWSLNGNWYSTAQVERMMHLKSFL